jgi:hypothetical protein
LVIEKEVIDQEEEDLLEEEKLVIGCKYEKKYYKFK